MYVKRGQLKIFILIFIMLFMLVGTASGIDGWITSENIDSHIFKLIQPFEFYLGMSLSEAAASLGNPISVSVQRGNEFWQDDPVFTYASQLSLYWYNDHVWQIRVDDPDYSRLTTEIVIERLGNPWKIDSKSLIYLLPGTDFPIRLKILIDAEESAVFIYRGDL